ncbi:MAG: molybdenum cofactor guanylyltransferase [Caldilineaceae bacterium]|nr:molybdenum cofactor guanylyltransferase [Caldilineaceae bacterium]
MREALEALLHTTQLFERSHFMQRVTLMINAGGGSQRMGQPKALLPVPPDNQPLLAHIVQRLQGLAPAQTVIIANAPMVRAQTELGDAVRWLTDAYPNQGPLGGLAAGLAVCDEWAIFVACDMPLLNPALFAYFGALAAETDEQGAACWDAIVPLVDDYPQVLHALYHPRCLPFVQARLAAGERRAICFLPDVRVRYVQEAELQMIDPMLQSFFNANTPAEWSQALALLH